MPEPLAVGLDFSFSFPAWYCAARGWSTAAQAWDGVTGAAGDALLADERFPFWGRTHPRPDHRADQPPLRVTEEGPLRAKSVFQIGGAGAVGTGSIRGMPCLATLRERFAIWPFDTPAPPPVIVEIYPRRLYPPSPPGARLSKRSWTARHAHLRHWFPDHPPTLLERAAGSEDAFDAAVSALVMSAHARELGVLPGPRTPTEALEGRVWAPDRSSPRLTAAR